MLAISGGGCATAARPPASSPPPPPALPSPPSSTPVPTPAPAADEPAVAAWTLPASELGTHRLFRVHYEGPEGEGSFRLTLELEAADRYRARAVDLLGRPLWSLSFYQSRGQWIDHRAEVHCRLVDRLDLAGLPLAPFPLTLLPPLLLGRLPEPPAPGTTPRRDGDELTFVDRFDRRWTAGLAAGSAAVERWSLRAAADGALPQLSWLRVPGGEAILSDRKNAVQLRWREVVEQPLAEPLPAAGSESPPPSGYREVSCREAYQAGI